MIKYIILGIIQGITEVLPISSSAHLLFYSTLLNEEVSLAFEIILHFASLLAIVIFERKIIKDLITCFFKYIKRKEEKDKTSFQLVIYLIISTIPLVLVSLIIKPWIEKINTNLLFVGIFLIINSFFLFYISKVKNDNNDLNLKCSVIIGITQMMSIFSGISRSGSCLLGGKLAKTEKTQVAKYAFLLFIPVCLGAIVYDILFLDAFVINKEVVMAFLCAFLFTYLSLIFLFSLINKGKIKYFAYYSFVFAIVMVILYLFQRKII